MIVCSFCDKLLHKGVWAMVRDETGATFRLAFCDAACVTAAFTQLREKVGVTA